MPGKADISSVSSSTCHIGGPNSVNPGQILLIYGTQCVIFQQKYVSLSWVSWNQNLLTTVIFKVDHTSRFWVQVRTSGNLVPGHALQGNNFGGLQKDAMRNIYAYLQSLSRLDPMIIQCIQNLARPEAVEMDDYQVSCLLMVFVAVSIPRLARSDSSIYKVSSHLLRNATTLQSMTINDLNDKCVLFFRPPWRPMPITFTAWR